MRQSRHQINIGNAGYGEYYQCDEFHIASISIEEDAVASIGVSNIRTPTLFIVLQGHNYIGYRAEPDDQIRIDCNGGRILVFDTSGQRQRMLKASDRIADPCEN